MPTSPRSTGFAGSRSSPCCSSTPASCRAASSASTCSSRCPGFLITSLLLAEVDVTGRVDVVAFWGRRFRRLLPAVLLLLVVVTVITTIVASVPERAATLDDGPWAQAYLANWHAIAGHRDYWASFELPRMFGHLWSLAIEEQFYLVWPVIVGLIAWRSRNAHRTVIVVLRRRLGRCRCCWMIALFDPADPTRVYIGTDTRASSLLLGALFAAAPLRSAVSRRHLATRRGVHRWSRAMVAVIDRAVVVPDRRAIVVVAVPWWAVRPFAAVGGAGRGMRGAAERSGVAVDRLGAAARHRRAVVQPVPVALAGLRAAVAATHRHVGMVAARACGSLLRSPPQLSRRCWSRIRSGSGRRGHVAAQGVVTLIAVTAAVAAFWVLVPRPETAPAVFSLDQFASTTAATDQCSATVHDCIQRRPRRSRRRRRSPPRARPRRRHDHVSVAADQLAPTLLAPTSRVLMVGDSVAFDEWPAVAAAMYAGKIAIGSYVSPGAGLLDTKYDSTAEIDKMVADFKPDLVLYQGSLWDFGTADHNVPPTSASPTT